MTTVADVLAETLVEAGIERVFGLPGGEIVGVLDALRRRQIDFVLVHNESSAVFMADVTARLTGKPGVALTTLGPGATNAIVGVAHADLDRGPVVIITAQVPDELHGKHTHQLVDLQALYRPITKGTAKLTPTNVAATVRRALALAQADRPGPVHLQISKEVAALPVAEPASEETDLSALPDHAATGEVVIRLAAARKLLAEARRPVILAGLGLEPERPYGALRALAEALQAPVITTPKAKGALPADHPLSAGTVGLTRTDQVYELIDEADCILALGFDVVELVKLWDQPAPLIWLAPWSNEDPTLTAEVEFVGAMEPILNQLSDSTFNPDPAWGVERVAAFHQQATAPTLPEPGPGRLLPQTVMQIVRRYLPAESPVAVDVGSHKILGSLTWPANVPNRFFLSNGLSSMGFALPAMIAAALAVPDWPALCLTGDAGLSMVSGELGVVAARQLPVIVVVFNDGAIDLIRSHQVRSGYPVFGTEFTSPNFTQIATAYGIEGWRVTTAAECAAAMQQAVASRRPALIEAMIDPSSYPTTPEALRPR